MAESHEARSQAPAKRRAWPQTRGAGRKALFAGAGGQLWFFRQPGAGVFLPRQSVKKVEVQEALLPAGVIGA